MAMLNPGFPNVNFKTNSSLKTEDSVAKKKDIRGKAASHNGGNQNNKQSKEHPWSPSGVVWCGDRRLKDIFFLDKNLNISQISRSRLYRYSKVLPFPHQYGNYKDNEVLQEVINFINKNSVLIENKVNFHFVTYDEDFQDDSNAVNLLKRAKIRIMFQNLNQSEMIVDQINKMAEGNKRWISYLK